jgi:hypothetical protein
MHRVGLADRVAPAGGAGRVTVLSMPPCLDHGGNYGGHVNNPFSPRFMVAQRFPTLQLKGEVYLSFADYRKASERTRLDCVECLSAKRQRQKLPPCHERLCDRGRVYQNVFLDSYV